MGKGWLFASSAAGLLADPRLLEVLQDLRPPVLELVVEHFEGSDDILQRQEGQPLERLRAQAERFDLAAP
eukprot:7255645-Pyramimonas_sp.AAC.1